MNKNELPYVSICTPTYNRSIFLDIWAECIRLQDYPSELIEVLVANDSTDNTLGILEQLRPTLPNLRVFNFDGKNSNSIKRQWLNDRADGDIIIHFDDDDYYLPTRVSTAVEALIESDKLLAGHSELYIWHVLDAVASKMGPYHARHACCGSFAYKKEYTITNKFEDTHSGPEPGFTRNFREPMIQLDPLKSMICIDHGKNTIKKKKEDILSDFNIREYILSDKAWDLYSYLKM